MTHTEGIARYLVLVVFFFVLCALPLATHALGAGANAMCNPWYAQCGCNQVPCKKGCCPGKNTNGCPVGICKDVTSGFPTLGICVAANQCEGKTSGGQGGDMKGLQEALGIAKQIMDLLKGAGEGGGGGDVGAQGGCLSGYYNTTSPSSTDPCAIYSPSVYTDSLTGGFGTSNVSNSLLDALNEGSNTTNVSETLNTATKNPTTTQTQTQTNTQTAVQTPTTSRSLTGSVRVGETGATIISNLREGVSEVAGFFGGSSFGGNSSQSVAGRLCTSRPWAQNGLLGKIIPDTFFDSICSRAGYQVGVPAPASSGSGTGTQTNRALRPSTNVPTTTPQRPADLGPVEVNIWAEPASVRLGTRTYLFWSSKNVVDCTVSGPNFTQRSLSGGASTVPISGPTTYTLSCTSPSGATTTDSVTVNLAL